MEKTNTITKGTEMKFQIQQQRKFQTKMNRKTLERRLMQNFVQVSN